MKFDPTNVRDGKPADAKDKELRQSLKNVGWLKHLPAILDRNGKVLVGARRMAIAKEENITPVIKTVDLSDDDSVQIAYASNRGAAAATKADRKRLAEHLCRDLKWKQERIAEVLGVSQKTISLDLANYTQGIIPTGAGRPRGKAPKRHPKADQVAALDGKTPRKEIAATTGLSERQVRHIAEEERLRREGEVQVDPATLSPTAQQKLDAALRQQQRRQDAEFEQRVTDEVRKRTETALPHLKAKQARADAISASYTPRFSKKDCLGVARCLHSDTWQSLNVPPELASRLKAAFVTFTKMQSFLCVE